MEPDLYPVARECILRHFGSLNEFIRRSGIPRTTVIRVINGKYGSEDHEQRDRIADALRGHGVPEGELRGIWAVMQDKGASKLVAFGGRKLKITTVTIIEDLGPADE